MFLHNFYCPFCFLLVALKTQFLIQECVSLITKPNFISTLCYAIDNPLHYQKVGALAIWVAKNTFYGHLLVLYVAGNNIFCSLYRV